MVGLAGCLTSAILSASDVNKNGLIEQFKENIMKRKSFLLIAVASLIYMCGADQAMAQHPGAQYLVEIGESYQRKGQIDEAVHEYSKALIIEPNNQQAKEHLKALGFDRGLYKPQETNLTRAVYGNQQVDLYQEKVDQLKEDQADVSDRLLQLQENNKKLKATNSAKSLKIEFLNRQLDEAAVSKFNEWKNEEDSLIERRKDTKKIYFESKQESVLDDQVDESTNSYDDLSALENNNHNFRSEQLKLKSSISDIHGAVEDLSYVRINDLEALQDKVYLRDLVLIENEKQMLDRTKQLIVLKEDLQKDESALIHESIHQDQMKEHLGIAQQRMQDIESEIQNLVQQRRDLSF